MTGERKTPYYQHENINMENETLPINIRFRTTNHNSVGCEFHWHEELEFYYVKKGGVLLLCNGKQQWIYEGQIGFVNWCQIHRGIEFLDNTEHYIIQIGTKFFSDEIISVAQKQKSNYLSMLIAQSKNFPLVFADCNPIVKSLEKIIFIQSNQGFAYELKLKSALYSLLANLAEYADSNCCFKDSKEHDTDLISLEHVKKILFYLSANYMNAEQVTLPELSHKFGLSIPYLCRIFKHYTNMTVITYLQELRCSRAASYIRDGISLEKVVSLTGFQDYNYFSRIFKRVIGKSPSNYKKELAN